MNEEKEMNYKGIIFDLDGVIVFTDKFHYQAWKVIADEMGIYFDEQINHRLRGVSRMDSLDIILERYEGTPLSQEEKNVLAEKKNTIYRDLLQTMSAADVSAEVRETLIELRKRGIKIALGSSSKNAKFILEKVELLSLFDEISDGTNITKSKPDPEVFSMAAKFLGLEPGDCLVVEDADAGIEAAVSGGMHPVGIGEAAANEKAEYRLDTFADLLKIV